ncbi:MAG: flavodoxin domain-containing protein [Bacillota bacterium]
MINAIVVYKSKYGSSEKYARWIAERLDCKLVEGSQARIEDLLSYDTIIFGAGLYACSINGIGLITKNFSQLRDKQLLVYTVGLADPEKDAQYRVVGQKNFTSEMLERIKLFHFRGAINYKELSFIHRIMMAMMKNIVRKKKNLGQDDITFLETYGKEIDFVDQAYIEPLLSYLAEQNR